MIIELVNKEFKLAKAKSGNKFTLIAILLKAIAACLLIALISYLTNSIIIFYLLYIWRRTNSSYPSSNKDYEMLNQR